MHGYTQKLDISHSDLIMVLPLFPHYRSILAASTSASLGALGSHREIIK